MLLKDIKSVLFSGARTSLHELMNAAEGHGADAAGGVPVLPVHQKFLVVIVLRERTSGGWRQGGQSSVLEQSLQDRI